MGSQGSQIVEEEISWKQLHAMSAKDLKRQAKERGIEWERGMEKADLVKQIWCHDRDCSITVKLGLDKEIGQMNRQELLQRLSEPEAQVSPGAGKLRELLREGAE